MEMKPNILFIMTDQQHDRMMSCAGNKWLDTPAMDSLADEGIRFSKAYCSNPVCAPSRISMATGMMSCRLGADDNGSFCEKVGLPEEVNCNSMGKLMKKAGYATFYGGKVHMTRQLQPPVAGYDVFFSDDREALPAACIDFIKQKRDEPFFAVASFINPHDICFAHRAKNDVNTHDVLELRKEALELPLEELPPLPDNYEITVDEPSAVDVYLNPNAITPAIVMRDEYDDYEWRINRWIYHRLTEQVDKLIGEILQGLKESGHEGDTLILLTSDHGNMDASHHLASKGLFYEESVKVPFIMKYPHEIPEGIIDNENLISTGLDILPTMCDYAGVEKPEHMLGKSLRPVAERGDSSELEPYVTSENHWFRMIRSKQYKYCCFAPGRPGEFLVDLKNDPGELRNLAGDPEYKSILDAHREILKEWLDISKDEKGKEFLNSMTS